MSEIVLKYHGGQLDGAEWRCPCVIDDALRSQYSVGSTHMAVNPDVFSLPGGTDGHYHSYKTVSLSEHDDTLTVTLDFTGDRVDKPGD